MTNQNTTNIYVASCTENGGIYQYHLLNNALVPVAFTPMDRPMYMMIKDRKLYVVLRAPFESDESGLVTFDLDEEGRLTNPSAPISTMGRVGCHIAVHEGAVYCANYASGSIFRAPDRCSQHHGSGIHPRQNGPHAHFVGPTPDGTYICATDLGLDTIFLYRKDLTLHGSAKVPEGHGVRHLVFSEDGSCLFAANELGSSVAAFSYADGSLNLLDVCSTLPDDFAGTSAAAAIRLHGDAIYVSNRGCDTIAELRWNGAKLEQTRQISCHGQFPWDFIFIGNTILCTNKDSNEVVILDAEHDFALLSRTSVEAPLCVCSL